MLVKNGVVTNARIRRVAADDPGAHAARSASTPMSYSAGPRKALKMRKLPLAPVAAAAVAELLVHQGALLETRIGPNGVACEPGEIGATENVRFNKGEKKNKDQPAKQMALLCDVYVMDAFDGILRRGQAPTAWPSSALVACVVAAHGAESRRRGARNPSCWLIAIVGGSKVSTSSPCSRTWARSTS